MPGVGHEAASRNGAAVLRNILSPPCRAVAAVLTPRSQYEGLARLGLFMRAAPLSAIRPALDEDDTRCDTPILRDHGNVSSPSVSSGRLYASRRREAIGGQFQFQHRFVPRSLEVE